MASITPLSALPANGVTPAGTLTLSNLQGRLTCFLTSGGTATLRLITMTEGGNWGYVEGGELVVNTLNNLGDNVGFLDFTNASTTTKYHCVLNGGSSPVSAWLSSLTGPGTSTALVAHASSHLSGASDDLLGSPGNVGDVTPGVYCGTFGPDLSHQNTVPSKNGDTFSLLALAQTFSAVKTFSAAPVFGAGLTASGSVSNDFSGGTGTFKTSTGAVTIGGGAAAITATSSAAAITITAGAASTWSTTAGALNLAGASGVNLKLGSTLIADAGATAAGDFTLAANKNLSASAGTGAITLSNMTGDTALPTGNLAWAAAATKTLSLAAAGAAAVTSSGGALTLTGAAASSWSTSAGALSVSGFAGINLKINGTTVADVGATTAGSVTLAANKSLDFAAGTGAISAGSATGDTTLTTGALTWTGASSKAGSIKAGTSAALTLGGNGASVASFDAAGLGFLMASGKVVGFGAPQALSGAGAVNVTTFATLFTSSGSAQALTLADGVMAGQVKFVMHIVDGGSGVLTPTTPTGFATITFTNVRDWAALIWTGAAWAPLAYSGATFA